GKSGYGAHVYDDDADTTCNTCGYIRVVTPSAPEHTHNWAEAWTNNTTHHWHECDASDCIITDNKDKDSYGVHIYDDDTDSTCNTCGYIRAVTPPVPEHTHSWAEAWTNNAIHHWHECDASECTITDNKDKDGYSVHIYDDDADTTCNTCGYIRAVTPPVSEHTHSWAEAWTNNATYHWHECDASECTITDNKDKDGYGVHIYDDDTDSTCNTCDYIRTVTPPTPPRPVGGNETYYISIPKSDNGEIIPNTRHAEDGDRVTLTAHPNAGYELDSLTVTNVRGREITLRDLGNNRYSFTMPNSRVSVDASFTKITDNTSSVPAEDEPFTGLGTPGISGIVLNPAPIPFIDVRTTHWFYHNVEYVWKHYLMSGVSDTRFAPNDTTTCAMIWTILARMNNVRTDVNPGTTWYERGMLWAMKRGVTDGTNPMDNITREQLATMLWRNAGSPNATNDLTWFSDSSSVSGYALTAVRWAAMNGILQGTNRKLNPKETATRAEVATMVIRYAEFIGA
ncbi:MAG: S-layer homology domain-containing protein, partial [Oscillospiraceae bacterium]|nr:S-layer homology domain-containing protein [Oscillospiraceae bacterium]